MSLVNDMLRDLDQRRQQTPGAKGMTMTAAPGQAQPAKKSRWLMLALLSALVVITVAGLWLYDNLQRWQQQAAPTLTTNPPVAPITPSSNRVAKPAAEMLVTAVQVERLSWSRQNRQLQLRLDLNRAPLQRVEVSTDRTLTLGLGVVAAGDVELPAAPADLIRSAQWVRTDDKLALELASSQPVTFAVVANSREGHYQLTISIDPQQTVPVVESADLAQDVPASSTRVAAQPESKPNPKAQTKPTRSPSVKPPAASVAATDAASPASTPLRKLVHQTPQQRDHAMAVKANGLISQRQLSQAQQMLAEFIDNHPIASDSRALLATIKIGTQQLQQAEQLIDQGLLLDASDSGLRKLKARLLLQAGQLPAAIELLSTEMPSIASDTDFHQIRAAALQAAGQHQQAAEAYHGLLRVRSSEPPWWIGLALSLEALQQPRQARQAYQNVLKIPQLSSTLSDYVEQRLARLGG